MNLHWWTPGGGGRWVRWGGLFPGSLSPSLWNFSGDFIAIFISGSVGLSRALRSAWVLVFSASAIILLFYLCLFCCSFNRCIAQSIARYAPNLFHPILQQSFTSSLFHWFAHSLAPLFIGRYYSRVHMSRYHVLLTPVKVVFMWTCIACLNAYLDVCINIYMHLLTNIHIYILLLIMVIQ